MPRELWKGAVRFGLVHIPVSLYPAEQSEELRKDAKVQPNEIKMAERLIDDMSMKWDPKEYHDTYRDDLLKLIEEKASGRLKAAPKAKRAPRGAEVIDFAKLLERSLSTRKRGPATANDEEAAPRRATSGERRRAPAAKVRRKTARTATSHRRAA